MQATDVHGQTFKNGTVTLLARIVGQDGDNLVKADLSTITYTIYLLDERDPDARTAVSEHSAVPVTVANAIFDTLQTGGVWDVDETGYNFRHTLDVSEHEAFAIAGRCYLVEFRMTPTSGQVIVVRFRLKVV